MKNNRNCSQPYPVYPMPTMIPNMATNMMPNMMQPIMSNPAYDNNEINNLEQRISSLEKRVSTLENMYNNNYNSSNYQML